MVFWNIAWACKEKQDVQNELIEKIFMRFLMENKRESAYDTFLKGMDPSDTTDRLSIELYKACVEKNDQPMAKKAVDKISNREQQEIYISKYQAKWGTS